MKRIFGFIAISLILVSCGASDEDYVKAAEELCDCVSKEKAKPENIDLVEKGIVTDADATAYNFCMENQMKDKGVDFKDQRMLDALKDKCPDLVAAHTEYMNSAAGKGSKKEEEKVEEPVAKTDDDYLVLAKKVKEAYDGYVGDQELSMEEKVTHYSNALMGAPNEKELDMTGEDFGKALETVGLKEVHDAMMEAFM